MSSFFITAKYNEFEFKIMYIIKAERKEYLWLLINSEATWGVLLLFPSKASSPPSYEQHETIG